MRHVDTQEADYAEDSFLDVVANVVGVLIILVMIIGAAASGGMLNSDDLAKVEQPESKLQDEPREDSELLEHQLEKVEQRLAFEARELRDTTASIVNIGYQAAHQERLRLELAVHRAAVDEDLKRRRDALSAEDQQEYDVQNQIFEAKLRLDELSNQQLSLLSDPGVVEEIEVEPTPVARKVSEDAIHLRLMGGAVCKVPFHELMEELEYERASIRRDMSNNNSVNLVVGPIDGFRLRLRSIQLNSGRSVTGPVVGNLGGRKLHVPRLDYLPVADTLGEPIDQALLPDSSLHRNLEMAKRRTSVVVAWVYHDSFDDYRTLRELLTEMGFSIAVYPLPAGAKISAGPGGTEARAQ